MEKYIGTDLLMEMESRKKAMLINSLGGFKSVCMIGTQDAEGHTNLAVFSSVVHIGASPPLICFVMRPDSVERHTLFNILATGFYTINHLNEINYLKAHQSSASYPREISEFDATGLSPLYKNGFPAPYVKESAIQLGVQFRQRMDIALNKTSLIIGEILHIYFPEDCLSADHYLDIEKAGTITCSGLDSYHKTERLNRLSYAKPDQDIRAL